MSDWIMTQGLVRNDSRTDMRSDLRTDKYFDKCLRDKPLSWVKTKDAIASKKFFVISSVHRT